MQCTISTMAAAILFFVSSLAASAERRVALVIGNSAYRHATELANPKNDAVDMAEALRNLSFQVVAGFDLDKVAMDRTIREFANVLEHTDVALFFYAGHGLQVGGINYLVPVDAQLSTSAALDWEMVRLDLIQRTMEREVKANIIFLDACRDNPLARNLARAMGTRSGDIGRGLAAAESGIGTLISFSTQPGNVALDGTGRNSPFAGALVRQIANSRSHVGDMLYEVRREVMAATKNKQVPWEHTALTSPVYLRSPASSQGGVPPVAAVPETPKPLPAPKAPEPATTNLPARQLPHVEQPVWSAWLDQNAFQQEFDRNVAEQRFPRIVEGRAVAGRVTYRAQFVPFERGFWGYTHHSITDQQFDAAHAKYTREGLRLVHRQRIVVGQRSYNQVIWTNE